MPNLTYQEYFRVAIAGAIEKNRAASQIDHLGLRGQVREIFAKDLLLPILPVDVAVATGKIVDEYGNASAQCDLIVYGRNIVPSLLFDASTGLIPVEACIFAIEVKSKMTSDGMRDCLSKASSLKELGSSHPVPAPISIVFAFDSDLSGTGKTEIDRYLELDENGELAPAIPVICVAEKGHWHFKDENEMPTWTYVSSDDRRSEMLAFLGMFTNSIRRQLDQRNGINFGNYIVDPDIGVTI